MLKSHLNKKMCIVKLVKGNNEYQVWQLLIFLKQ